MQALQGNEWTDMGRLPNEFSDAVDGLLGRDECPAGKRDLVQGLQNLILNTNPYGPELRFARL